MRVRRATWAVVVVVTLVLLNQISPTIAQGRSWEFDEDAIDQIASGFTQASGRWKVTEDSSAPSGSRVLAQLAANAGSTFNLVLVDDVRFRDVDVSVRLRAVAGEEDQGGGVVWRARDARNYYVARYNPLEDNFRVYFVKDGQRRTLNGVSVDLDHRAWHTVRVTMRGDQIECFLDGTKSMGVQDKTFPDDGKVGLWTKADARTQFDDFSANGTKDTEKRDTGD